VEVEGASVAEVIRRHDVTCQHLYPCRRDLCRNYWSGLGDLELRGITERRMSEETADPVGQLGDPAHVADDCTLEFGFAAGGRLAGDSLLQVGVQTFVRVQLRTIGWQVEDLDLLRARG
jgi:hypothetical protein